MTKIACVAVVKDEAVHIAEWIAYQFVIGFDTVIILDNLSSDATREIALAFAPRWDVRVLEAPFEGANFYGFSYMLALEKFGPEFAWMAFFDADEFLVLDGGRSIAQALAPLDGINAVAVNWAIFGSSGHVSRPAGLTIANYLMRSTLECQTNRHVKSIVRPEAVRRCQITHKFEMAGDYHDLAGQAVQWEIDGIILGPSRHVGGKLHHYFSRSREDFDAKLKRGYRDVTRSSSAFESCDQNDVRDDSAALHAPAVERILAAVTAPRITCAVVLMVKDETHDIAAWLAWYHVLGFNACIVFDDDSTDGTWEILQRAAQVQDIRLYRTLGPKETADDVWRRQHVCFEYALKRYRDEFEWLAFFDADEFLLLNQDETVQAFLARFAHADAVGVNWCLYGSNGHLLKPDRLPTEAFTRHGHPYHTINRHVKSLVRPAKVGAQWHNVHWFDVDPQRAKLANGREVSWSETIGIINEDPDWSVAKLMHYQIRSRAHFDERMAKRPEAARSSNAFESLDLNEVEDATPLRFSQAVKRQLAAYEQQTAPVTTMPMAVDIGAVKAKRIWIEPLGNVGNRALQYLAAREMAAHCPGAVIENIDLPEWGLVRHDPEPPEPNSVTTGFHGGIDAAGLGDCLARNVVDSVLINGYPFHLDNLPSRDVAREILPGFGDELGAVGFGPEELLCNVRSGEITAGVHPDYVLLPPSYYRRLVEMTGLRPVFYGQLGDNPYIDLLRREFPAAAFIDGKNPRHDFEVIRRSVNIAPAVSTFSWLAAWLSYARRVILPVAGMFSPMQLREMMFLPLDDPTFEYVLFPYTKMTSIHEFPAQFALTQELLGHARPVSTTELAEILRRARELRTPIARVTAFDADFYLKCYPDVADALQHGLRSALQHYLHSGFRENRDPFRLDTAFYANMYPDAALAIAEGHYADPFHHYLAAGRALGYQPHP